MTVRFFKGIATLQELRNKYKELLKQYHPDNGGDAEIAKAVNAEYDYVRTHTEMLNRPDVGDGKSYKVKWDADTSKVDADLRATLMKIIGLAGIDIDILGNWIWVSGDTREHKDALKAAGLFYSGNRKMWYWRADGNKRKASKKSYRTLYAIYNGQTVDNEPKPELAAA